MVCRFDFILTCSSDKTNPDYFSENELCFFLTRWKLAFLINDYSLGFDSQTKLSFEQIKTTRKVFEKYSGFVDSGLDCMIGITS